jgi:hypothetical protein
MINDIDIKNKLGLIIPVYWCNLAKSIQIVITPKILSGVNSSSQVSPFA